MPNIINEHHLESGLSYPAYRELINNLLNEGKTTGNNPENEAAVAVTKLNVQRMRRLDKTIKLQPELVIQLEKVKQTWTWVVITEGWCGDSAQSVPVFAKISEMNSNIRLNMISRDKYPDLMDAYLTDGKRSIPKLICLNLDLQELGTWGARPKPAKQILQKYKEKYGEQFRDHYNEFTEELHLWYARDRTQTIQTELKEKIGDWLKIADQ